jgi:PAS domain S-box-containing protein
MKQKRTFEEGTTLRAAAMIAFFLLLAFITLWLRFGVDSENLHNYLFGAIVFCVALVTVSVFQAFKISENAEAITEKMSQQIIDSAHDLFVELYKKSPVPYILIDRSGLIDSTNIAAIRLFKVGVGELDGKNIFEFIEGDDEVHIDFLSDKFIKGLSINDEEVRIKRSDGTTRWVLLSLFTFNDEKNAEQHGFLTLVDITRQKDIDKAKSEFVSLASHQLRTPLTAMKWSLELLFEKSKDEISEGEMKYLSKIGSNLERMGLLINDFLSVSKFELGTYSVELAPVNFSEVVDELIDENDHRMKEHEVTIEKRFDQNATSITSDPQLLRMIIGNLLTNAIKYSHKGGTVVITAEKEEHKFMIAVADSGMGIPLEDQEMLFTKMFRARNARRDVPEGTGLGLYIVDSAVRTLGGKISFDSAENKGTTFKVELPV